MAIYILTSNPTALLKAFKKAIDESTILTWGYDIDGDFTHTAAQWKNKAWLGAKVTSDELVLSIIPPKGGSVSKVVYGVYHGRFIESMLSHFNTKFTYAYASANAEDDDNLGV